MTFRKKGITDYVNLQYRNGIHANPRYRNAYAQNNSIFNKSRGQFTHAFDSAKLMGLSKQFTHTSMSPKG